MSRNEEFHNQYRGSHQPDIEGPGIHEVDRIYPDFYDHPRWYHHGAGASYDKESTQVIMGARGNPDHPVRIFRAVPHGVKDINPGDWVTPSRSYANQHAESNLDSDKWSVLSKVVPAKHVVEGSGNSINEWGYRP